MYFWRAHSISPKATEAFKGFITRPKYRRDKRLVQRSDFARIGVEYSSGARPLPQLYHEFISCRARDKGLEALVADSLYACKFKTEPDNYTVSLH